jgi:hypothetical protein
MFVESVVGERNVSPVPVLPVTALVATDQQDGSTRWVEGEEHSDFGPPCRPGPKFLQVGVATSADRVDQRAPKNRSTIAKDTNRCKKCLSVGLTE